MGDRLIYKGDTISVYPFILEKYIYEHPKKEEAYKEIYKSGYGPTSCWRGFVALFELKNDSLFLVKTHGKIDIDLSVTFGKKNNVFIGWYSGALTSPKNNKIYWHDGWGGFYEYETDFVFENGILKDVKEYHNYVKPTIYTENDTLMKFINSNINYNNVKPVDKDIRVTTRIDEVDDDGKITKVSVLRGHEDYNKEAIRVVMSIPQWQVIIRRGEKKHIYWTIPVIFRKENNGRRNDI